MMARAGSQSPFQEASEDLRVYAGIQVGAKAVERVAESVGEAAECWSQREGREAAREGESKLDPIPVFYVCMDGTGVPVTAREREGRRGRQPDGKARTREVKLGCVFTQTGSDEAGRPRRDPESTTFVGAVERAAAFGWRHNPSTSGRTQTSLREFQEHHAGQLYRPVSELQRSVALFLREVGPEVFRPGHSYQLVRLPVINIASAIGD